MEGFFFRFSVKKQLAQLFKNDPKMTIPDDFE